MIAMDVPIEVGGVHVEPGDFIFGDVDGVVVLPKAEAAATFAAALAKVSAENRTRDDLRTGMKLRDVFERYGVL